MRTAAFRIAFVCVVTALVGVADSRAQTYELIANGSFDSDIAGWELPAVADTTVTWQGDGVPGGSLRIESSLIAPEGTGIFVRSPCIVLEPGSDYSRYADVRAQSTPPGAGACNFDIFLYPDDACTEPSHSNTFSDAGPDGVWTPIAGGPTALSSPSARIVLWLRRFPSDVSVCSFDNVSFLGPTPSALEIPSASHAGLGLFALVVAMSAMVALRRSC